MASSEHLPSQSIPIREQQAIPLQTDPPPYSAVVDEDEETSCPETILKLKLNAAHDVRGCNNIIANPSSVTTIAAAIKSIEMLLGSIDQENDSAASETSMGVDSTRVSQRPRALDIELTINCGVTVIGSRNVVGPVGLRPEAFQRGAMLSAPIAQSMNRTPAAGTVTKRKAEDTDEFNEPQPPAKRPATLFRRG